MSDSTLNITGGNNQFAVVYKDAPSGDAGAGGIGAGQGGNPPFGAPGSLNNTNPAYDFSSLDNGKVYVITNGQAQTTIDGGNQQFVVEYLLPAPDGTAGAADTGGNMINVGGGNNLFVVSYEATDPTAASGNAVTVGGGNNQFVVAYASPGAGSGNSVAVDGGGNKFVAAYNSVQSGDGSASPAGASSLGQGDMGSNSSGIVVGNPGNNAVSISGDNNQYVVQYGVAPSADGSPSSAPGAGSNPFSSFGGAPGNSGAGGAPAGSAPGGGDLAALLAQSPFGPLLNLPGVTAQNLFSNVNPNDYSGGNPFAALGANAGSGAYGGNPFAGLGGNPAPTSSGASGGASAAPDLSSIFASFGGAAGAASGDLASQLGQSPFAPLLNLPGVSANDIASALASGGSGDPSYPSNSDYSGITLQSVLSALGATGQSGSTASSGPFASLADGSGSSVLGTGTPLGSLIAPGSGGLSAAGGVPSNLSGDLAVAGVPNVDAFNGQLASIMANFDPFAMGSPLASLVGSGSSGFSAAGGVPSNLSGALTAPGVPNADAVGSAVTNLGSGAPSNFSSMISGLAASYGVPAQYLPST